MNIKDHVKGIEMDCGIGMGGKGIKELLAFFIVDLVPLACLLAMV